MYISSEKMYISTGEMYYSYLARDISVGRQIEIYIFSLEIYISSHEKHISSIVIYILFCH